jgi:hypothetical protein
LFVLQSLVLALVQPALIFPVLCPERGVHAASAYAHQHAQKFSNAHTNSDAEAG